MTNQEIFELLDRFERSAIVELKLTQGDCSISMSKASVQASAAQAVPTPAQRPVSQETVRQPEHVIAAPLAGVFYAASEPGARPYVVVGDRVKKGETVCLMEAMKMISEVPAPCDCIITGILKENGALAAFEEPIFRYQPC